MKTLKEVAEKLNISVNKASIIKKKIESKYYRGVPSFMVWGTGNKKKYDIDLFKKMLNK